MKTATVAFAWSLFAVFAAVARPAAADPAAPTPLEIEVRSAAGCPSKEDFTRDLLARTTLVRLAKSGEASARVDAALDVAAGSAHGELTIRALDGSSSHREVQGDSCDEVSRAIVLFAALAFDPNAVAQPLVPVPPIQPLPIQPRVDSPPIVQQRAEVPRPPPEPLLPRFRFAFGATAGLGFGVAKGALAGGGGFVELTRLRGSILSPSARLGVEHAVAPTVHAGTGTVDFARTIALAEACPLRALLARVDLAACADGEIGALTATGAGVRDAKSVTRPWASAGLGGRAGLRLAGPVFIDVGVAAMIALTRDEFLFDPSIPVSEALPVGLRTTFGLGVAVP